MSNYRKLHQACCNYGCVGSYLPASYTIEHIYSGGTWGPGYEALNPGRIECPYDNGPLPNNTTMRCEWLGYWTPFTFAWLIQRWCSNGDQTQFQVQARMDWPGKGAYAEYHLVDGYFEAGPCNQRWDLPLGDFASGDNLMDPPTFISVRPWMIGDVPLPPP